MKNEKLYKGEDLLPLLKGVGDYNTLNTPEMTQQSCSDDRFVFNPPAEAGSQPSKHFVGATPQTQSHLALWHPLASRHRCAAGASASPQMPRGPLFSPRLFSVPLSKIPLGSNNLKSINPVVQSWAFDPILNDATAPWVQASHNASLHS